MLDYSVSGFSAATENKKNKFPQQCTDKGVTW